MKKTFLANRNALLSSRHLSWGVGVFALVLIALLVRVLAPNMFYQAATPFFKMSDAFGSGTNTFFNSFRTTTTLAELNETLLARNTLLLNENQMLLQKTADLSKLLNASIEGTPSPGILAGVVARPPESPYDTLLIAAGEKAGVRVGMEVFGESGAPIGVVSDLLADFSRVTLFSAPGMTTSGWVGASSVPLSLIGEGGGALRASVARVADIVVGDIVFVPGPGQLPIGSVVRVDGDAVSPGVILRIRPFTNLFSTTWVVVRTTGIAPSLIATSTLP